MSAAGGASHVLAAAASGIDEQVRRRGGDPDAMLAGCGLSHEALCDMRRPVDLGAYVGLIETAARQTGDDNFGLGYGQVFTPEMLGLIGMIAISSPDLGAALANLAAYFPYHQQTTQTRLLARDGVYRLEYRILDGGIVARRQDAELTLGMFANIFRRCVGERWAPEELHLEHPRPDGWRAHERMFDAPVHFSQRTNAIVFSAQDLRRPMPGADAAGLARLTAEITAIAGAQQALSLIDLVRSEIRSCLTEGGVGVEDVAEALGLSRRRLQKALGREGCSFSDLVEDVRKQLAARYLIQPSLPITDIAFLLGYSELSAFTRSFTRWHGVSPSRWRSEHRLR